MAQLESLLVAPLPKPLLVVGTPIAALLLTSFFILWGFPYHHLTNRAAAQAASTLGVAIEAADAGLTLGFDGFGFQLRTIRVETPAGEVYELDSARFGPAWSLDWLTATPTLFIEIQSPLGNTQGIVQTGDAASWSGSIGGLALARLDFLEAMLPFKITGNLNAEGSLASRDGVLAGPLSFDLEDGLLGHPNLPVEIPYASIRGSLTFGDDSLLRIESFDLVGPMLNFSISGTVGRGEPLGQSPLDLTAQFENLSPEVASLLQVFGAQLGQGDSSTLKIGGSFDNPVIQ